MIQLDFTLRARLLFIASLAAAEKEWGGGGKKLNSPEAAKSSITKRAEQWTYYSLVVRSYQHVYYLVHVKNVWLPIKI